MYTYLSVTKLLFDAMCCRSAIGTYKRAATQLGMHGMSAYNLSTNTHQCANLVCRQFAYATNNRV